MRSINKNESAHTFPGFCLKLKLHHAPTKKLVCSLHGVSFRYSFFSFVAHYRYAQIIFWIVGDCSSSQNLNYPFRSFLSLLLTLLAMDHFA